MRSSSRQAWASVVSTSGSSGRAAAFQAAGTVTARRASTRRRSRGGITCTTFVSARTAGLLDARHRALRRRLHPDGQRDGLLVVDDERRQRGARGELVAALGAAVRVDRVAELAQPVDVAAQRARRHPQPVGQLRAGPEAVGLQQRQQPQRPRARVRHVSSVPAMRSESDRLVTS